MLCYAMSVCSNLDSTMGSAFAASELSMSHSENTGASAHAADIADQMLATIIDSANVETNGQSS